MSTLNEHEEAFCRAFIRREKRRRCLEFLADPRRRREVLDRLNHGADVELSRATLIPPGQRSAEPVEALLRKKGAPSACHVIAEGLEIEGQDLDGQEAPLREALAAAEMHYSAVVLSCIPGRLALYKEEAPGDWYLLERDLPPVGR